MVDSGYLGYRNSIFSLFRVGVTVEGKFWFFVLYCFDVIVASSIGLRTGGLVVSINFVINRIRG